MIDRILEVLKFKNLSPSQFADEIGVQRSNISHLVSGRNKPSLEFIQKIIRRFPDVNPDYLLSGQGELIRLGSQTTLVFESPELQSEEKEEITVSEGEKPEPVKQNRKKVSISPEIKPEKVEKPTKEEKPEKIVFFFRDKTFREYYPDQDQ